MLLSRSLVVLMFVVTFVGISPHGSEGSCLNKTCKLSSVWCSALQSYATLYTYDQAEDTFSAADGSGQLFILDTNQDFVKKADPTGCQCGYGFLVPGTGATGITLQTGSTAWTICTT